MSNLSSIETIGNTTKGDESKQTKSAKDVVEKKICGNNPPQPDKTFSCTTCGTTFNERRRLSRHQMVHTRERRFTCPEVNCGKTYVYCSNLREHQRATNHHNWPYRCGICWKAFAKEVHMHRHTAMACRLNLERFVQK